uniref:Spindle and kinetochore-associated protein 3 n=1 Tax=Ciona savignyi TaxID=51511 RepID=H2Z5B9_CIOSA
MEKSVQHRTAFSSLQNLASTIDTKVSVFEQQSKQILPYSFTRSAESLRKLNKMASEIHSLKDDCHLESTKQKITESLMTQMLVCSSDSLKFTQSVCNHLTENLASKGYVVLSERKPLKSKSATENTLKHSAETVENALISCENKDANNGTKEFCNSQEESETNRTSVKSPMCPFNQENDKMLSNAIKTPSPPRFCNATKQPQDNQEKCGGYQKPDMYFNSLLTPELPRLNAIARPNVPTTPDDEKFVLYSRKSLNSYTNQCAGSPDITIHQMSTKLQLKNDIHVNTPDSPDLQGLLKLNPQKSETHSYFQNLRYGGNSEVLSPEMPDFSISDLRCRDSDARRSKDWIDPAAYEQLPTSTKRLFSLECVNSALDSIRIHMKGIGAQRFGVKEIEDATGLGSKAKSCIYVLCSLKLIHKIPGSQVYELLT